MGLCVYDTGLGEPMTDLMIPDSAEEFRVAPWLEDLLASYPAANVQPALFGVLERLLAPFSAEIIQAATDTYITQNASPVAFPTPAQLLALCQKIDQEAELIEIESLRIYHANARDLFDFRKLVYAGQVGREQIIAFAAKLRRDGRPSAASAVERYLCY